MKRDMDLIRAILLRLEETELEPGSLYGFSNWDGEPFIEGWSPLEIAYNYDQMLKGGLLVDDGRARGQVGQLTYSGMEWAGHDFLDAVRSPEVWRKTKGLGEKVGSLTFDLLKQVAVDFAKSTIQHVLPGMV